MLLVAFWSQESLPAVALSGVSVFLAKCFFDLFYNSLIFLFKE